MHIHSGYILCALWGPFSVNVYGFFIALGIIICSWLISRNKQYTLLKLQSSFVDILLVCIAAGIFGGRLLEIISEPQIYSCWYDKCALWEGGFSALGSILGVITIAPMYLYYKNISFLPVCDLFAIYAPLFQAIARFGCLFAGCCYGTPTHSIIHVIYTNAYTLAPRNLTLHPTQLYSSCILFIIFLYMFFIAQHRKHREGSLFATYLMLTAAERFFVDFWRADRIFVDHLFLSFHQLIAGIIFFVLTFYLFLSHKPLACR